MVYPSMLLGRIGASGGNRTRGLQRDRLAFYSSELRSQNVLRPLQKWRRPVRNGHSTSQKPCLLVPQAGLEPTTFPV